MSKREVTPEQHAAAEERRGRFRGLVKQLAAMTDGERAELAGRLPGLVTCEGHALSVHNTMLIATQAPELGVTVVGGFQQWRRHGRRVKKGEHGLMIWFPRVKNGSGAGAPAEGEAEPEEVRFLMGTVFDVSQTEPAGAA